MSLSLVIKAAKHLAEKHPKQNCSEILRFNPGTKRDKLVVQICIEIIKD
jgi:hypothetical protein